MLLTLKTLGEVGQSLVLTRSKSELSGDTFACLLLWDENVGLSPIAYSRVGQSDSLVNARGTMSRQNTMVFIAVEFHRARKEKDDDDNV